MANNNLPTVKELRDGDIMRKGEQTQLNVILNEEPPKSWIKDHPIVKKVKYLPIERIEYLLTRIFINWYVEIKNIQTIANSVVVTIRLYYQDIFSENFLYQDGLGAAPIHTEKGKGATDFQYVLTDSVMKAAPAAESYAIKDAAEKIGKLFGKDLNRADKIMYESLIAIQETKDKMNEELFKETNQ